jgi:uncharacterized protein with HEPN domain
MFAYSVVRCLELVGEAATRVSEAQRAGRPDVPWQQIRRARNIFSHVYFGIDYDIVWPTVTEGLPVLIAILERSLGRTDEGGE